MTTPVYMPRAELRNDDLLEARVDFTIEWVKQARAGRPALANGDVPFVSQGPLRAGLFYLSWLAFAGKGSRQAAKA